MQARLAESLKSKEEERKEFEKRMNEAMRKLRSYEGTRREKQAKSKQHWRGRLNGLAASPGFGRGQSFRLGAAHGPELRSAKRKRAIRSMKSRRFRGAVERGIEQINVVKNRMTQFIPKEENAIFDVYRLILEDPGDHSADRTANLQRRLHR